MSRGAFITLEGTEGVGKSTNLEAVVDTLTEAGIPVVSTREPGGTPLAEQVRALLLEVREEPVHERAELLLMFAARAQHLAQVIEPALEAGRWVVCDRFTDATFAYQGGGRGADEALIQALQEIVHPGLEPDLTLYLDIDPRLAHARIADREHDRFEREKLPFFDRVRATYLERAAAAPRFRVVDASCPLTEVEAEVRRLVRAFVERW